MRCGPRSNRLDFAENLNFFIDSGSFSRFLPSAGIGRKVSACKMSEKLRADLDEFFGGLGRGPRTSWLDFGGDLDHDPEPGFFLKNSSFTIASCRQLRLNKRILSGGVRSTECYLVNITVATIAKIYDTIIQFNSHTVVPVACFTDDVWAAVVDDGVTGQ